MFKNWNDARRVFVKTYVARFDSRVDIVCSFDAREFDDVREAVRWLGEDRVNRYRAGRCEIVIRDEVGLNIPEDYVRWVWAQLPWETYRSFYSGAKRGRFSGYRRPRTRQRIREATFAEEGERHYRRDKNLPTYWDDIPRHRERSWKSHRTHQWRTV